MMYLTLTRHALQPATNVVNQWTPGAFLTAPEQRWRETDALHAYVEVYACHALHKYAYHALHEYTPT